MRCYNQDTLINTDRLATHVQESGPQAPAHASSFQGYSRSLALVPEHAAHVHKSRSPHSTLEVLHVMEIACGNLDCRVGEAPPNRSTHLHLEHGADRSGRSSRHDKPIPVGNIRDRLSGSSVDTQHAMLPRIVAQPTIVGA